MTREHLNPTGLRGRPSFDERMRSGRLQHVTHSRSGRSMRFDRQFDMLRRGDTARRMGLIDYRYRPRAADWRARAHRGPLSRRFVDIHFGFWYSGPGFYPRYSWLPRWSPWVHWTWWDYCYAPWDPRPMIVRPVIYAPVTTWDYWDVPVWQPLPEVSSGTWVDVPQVAVAEKLDLQLLAVRFVDAGHPEQELGPRYRVWFRNNSAVPIEEPFNVMLLASNDEQLAQGLPEAGVRVTSVDAGEIQAVDIRLPYAASTLDRDEQGRAIPFSTLHVLVDSHREVEEEFVDNNGIAIPRDDIFSVDPAIFSADSESIPAGSVVHLAGEGFGPEPGKVLVFVNGLELEGIIEGWYDLGVRVQLPDLPLAAETEAELLIVRQDGAISAPLPIEMTPFTGEELQFPEP